MAERNFKFCFDMVLHHEGGFVNHPRDPGGATNMGITLRTLQEWRGKPVSVEDVRDMKREEAMLIYLAEYWRPAHCDDWPDGVDLTVFDYAVNSGVAKAVLTLQKAAGVKADGIVGPKTRAAVRNHPPAKLIWRINTRRLNFLQRLRHWATFGRGWGRRVEATVLASMEMVKS
jgi:lysozyme family protein